MGEAWQNTPGHVDIVEVFSRLPDGIVKRFVYVNDNPDDSNYRVPLTNTICIGEWSRSFKILYKHSESELSVDDRLIENKIMGIIMSLIPDFVESINDAETWMIMGDYWEEQGDDRAIACRTVAENLKPITE